MSEYRTVEGAFTTIDTLANLTTFADETSVGPIKVPARASKITNIRATVGVEIAASEEQTYLLRLGGKGMASGTQDFTIASAAAQSGTAAAGIHKDVMDKDVEIGVVPNETITVSVGAAGTAISATGQAGVTLQFD